MEKEQSIIVSDMEEEFKSGLILQDTKAIGSMTRQIYMENSFIQTEILMKDNG
jgi:DNA polymerase sigma